MRRAGVELVIWSSRLLLPVALVAHLAVVWSVVARGTFAWVATLLAPGPAEIVWLVCGSTGVRRRVTPSWPPAARSARWSLLLGIGMVAMTERAQPRGRSPEP